MTINIHDFFELIAPHYAITALTMVSVFLIVEKDYSKVTLLFFPICAYLFALFGFNVLNNIFDARMDRISKPLRPIPSKRVSKKEAKILSMVFFVGSFVIAMFSLTLLLIIATFVIATVVYSHPKLFFRKHFWATPLFGMIFYGVVPFLIVTSQFSKETPFIFLLFFAGLIVPVSITKDIEDIKAEKKFGINSIPNLIGTDKTIWLAAIGLCLSLIIGGIVLTQENQIFFLPTIVSLFFTIVGSIKIIRTKIESNIITQSKIVSLFMVLVVFIQLLFGITVFLNKS